MHSCKYYYFVLFMSEAKLSRKISLLQASAINMIDMVGIGPFVVMSFVVQKLHGGYFLYAWIAGAVLSFIDGMVWSQLGSTFPLAGGSYNFLKEGFGEKWGKPMSFLFVWQTMIQAPLVIASAAIGFAQYLSYIVALNEFDSKMVSGAVVVLIVFLLYRKIEAIGKISVLLWIGVFVIMGWIIAGALMHGSFLQPVLHMNDGLTLNSGFAAALGFACVKTVYSYLGYYNVCLLGGEIINPERNIPRSMFISIAVICFLYLMMNISVASVLSLDTMAGSSFVVSEYINLIAGPTAAVVATAIILWVAFASVFSATLGYSRIPYAAAKDGAFFSVFAKLHPTKHFPYVSLIVLGSVAFIFSLLFRLSDVITAILAMRIIIQFVGQAVGLLLLHKRKSNSFFKWKMPLYPLPVFLAIAIWLFIFYSTEARMMLIAGVIIAAGIVAYLVKAFYKKEFPFVNKALLKEIDEIGK